MTRRDYLKKLAALPLLASPMNLSALKQFSDSLPAGDLMPVLFLGHGSPMNAIEENEFVKGFRNVAAEIPKPKAILCISAHWFTQGTFVTAMPMPKTIHDFGGFPDELFKVQYPAPGNPDLAKETAALVKSTTVGLDQSWGLDHGAWSVIKHLYPKADIPVIQFSIDYTKGPEFHYKLAKELQNLRKKGILIVGSGNIVHNLYMVDFKRINDTYGYDWAAEAREKINGFLLKGDDQSIVHYEKLGKALQLAAPSPDHFLPLIYTLGLKTEKESPQLFNDKILAGSLSMTSVKFG
jgi:4,5-DOPA dioxygenase extradiol